MSEERHPEICLVTHPLGAAGENATRTLLEILSAITTVTLMTADLPADSAIRGRHEVVELTDRGTGSSLPIAAGRFVRNQVRMCRAIARRDESIVLFFGATAYLLPIAVARLMGRTVILEPRGDVPLTLRLQWEQRLPAPIAALLAGIVEMLETAGYRLAHAIITYTPSMAEQLGLEKFTEKLYPNGARYVDTDRFAPGIPFESRDMVVGFLGRLDHEKNVRALATAARDLPAGVRFRFVGDGELRPELERDLAEEIEDGSVEFTGWVDHDQVPMELSKLRLLVLPSAPTEGLPTVILEAMGCGTPVYATPVSGVPDVVREDETGFLMRRDRPEAIREDIVAILERSDLTQVSASGRELVCAEYSFPAAIERYRAILRGVGGSE